MIIWECLLIKRDGPMVDHKSILNPQVDIQMISKVALVSKLKWEWIQPVSKEHTNVFSRKERSCTLTGLWTQFITFGKQTLTGRLFHYTALVVTSAVGFSHVHSVYVALLAW